MAMIDANPFIPSVTRDFSSNPVASILKPIHHGWAVVLTDGRELVRFTGLGAKRKALRFIAGYGVRREASHVY